MMVPYDISCEVLSWHPKKEKLTANAAGAGDINFVKMLVGAGATSYDWAMVRAGSEGGAGSQSPAVALQRWVTDDRGLQVFLVKLGEDNAANTAVIELRLDAGQVVAGTTDHLYASVAHFATEPRGEVTLELTVGDRPQAAKSIASIAERQQVTVDIETEFIRTGDESLRVRIPEPSCRNGLPNDMRSPKPNARTNSNDQASPLEGRHLAHS